MELKPNCLEYLVAVIAIFILAVVGWGVSALLVQLGWNYVVVDTLKLASTKMTFVAAFVTVIVLAIIGSFFKSSIKT